MLTRWDKNEKIIWKTKTVARYVTAIANKDQEIITELKNLKLDIYALSQTKKKAILELKSTYWYLVGNKNWNGSIRSKPIGTQEIWQKFITDIMCIILNTLVLYT